MHEMSNYEKTRYGIITLALEKMIKENKDFKNLLFFICLINSQDILKEMLEFFKEADLVESFIYYLKKNSLATHDLIGINDKKIPVISLHRSTQKISLSFLMNILTEEEKIDLIRKIMSSLMEFQDYYLKKNCNYVIKLINHLETFHRKLEQINLSSNFREKRKQDLFLMLGYAYQDCFENSLIAYEYFKNLININERSRHISNERMAVVLKDLGKVCVRLGEIDASIKYCQESLKLCNTLPNLEFITVLNLKILGTAWSQKNNLETGNFYFMEAIKKSSDIKDPLLRREIQASIYKNMAWNYSKKYLNKPEAQEAEKYALKSLETLNALDTLHKNLSKYPHKISPCILRGKETLGKVYCRLGKYDEALEKGFKDAQFILDNNLDGHLHFLSKAYMLLGRGEIYLRTGYPQKAEEELTESIQLSEKLAGNFDALQPRVFRAEARIALGKLNEAYEDCITAIKTERKISHNYFNLMYFTAYYHAALIKYKQHQYKLSAEHFTDFLKAMKEFCRTFLDAKDYEVLEGKRVFDKFNPHKNSEDFNCSMYLKRSAEIFTSIYGEHHPFIKDYIKNNK